MSLPFALTVCEMDKVSDIFSNFSKEEVPYLRHVVEIRVEFQFSG